MPLTITLHQYDLPLKHVFTIARGSISVQKTLIVELSYEGVSGFGEATTNSYYGATYEKMTEALRRVAPAIADLSPDEPEQLWQVASGQLHDHPFPLCALDEAAYDLWGKRLGRPVHELWGLDPTTGPASNYTIGIDSIEKMVAKMEEMPGWPIYKIKLGTENDLSIVRALRQHTDARFRVDANCGWSVDQAIAISAPLAELGVEFIEQPLPADQWDNARRLFKESALPIVADESCVIESDVARCAGHFHGINIKLMKCGGLTPARRMIAAARQLGLQVMTGCMTESTVGISAIAQILPLLDYVDMDGATLLAEDIATGPTLLKGVCHYPETSGSGITLTDAPPKASIKL